MATYPENIFNILYTNNEYKERVTNMTMRMTRKYPKKYFSKIISMIENNSSDRDICLLLTHYYNKFIDLVHSNDVIATQLRANQVSNILHEICVSIPSINNGVIARDDIKYMDMGCSGGSITMSVAKTFKINLENTYGIDLDKFVGKKIIPNTKFNFQYYDGNKIPYKDSTFDMITCLMMLHHVNDIDYTLSEIYRVLKNDALVIIKEHDVDNTMMDYLTYIEHLIYGVTSDGQTYDFFRETYTQNMLSSNELKSIMNMHGFKCMCISDDEFNMRHHGSNINGTYYSVYMKTQTL